MNGSEQQAIRQAVAYVAPWLSYQQALKEVPGIVSAIAYGNDAPVLGAYGYADLESQSPMTAEHIFRIASHSKTFTATAIMQLVERGALRLDDPAEQHIGWLQGEPARSSLRQLLSHAAGLTRDGSAADFWQLTMPFPDETQLRHLIEDDGQILPANDTFKYSNIGYSLLGLVIEAASGMSYAEYVTRHIVQRLGLPDTGPETDEHARARLVTGYTHRVPGMPRRPLADCETGAMAAATGFYSTAADLCRYAAAHVFGNTDLLSDASKRAMQAPTWTIDQSDDRYGLGLVALDIGDRTVFGHSGSFPGHATRTMFDPHDGLVVVVLTNEINGPAKAFANGIVKLIDLALKHAIDAPHPAYDRYTGRFLTTWGVTDIVQLGSALLMLSPELDDPTADLTTLEVVDDNTLRITATNGYGSLGQPVRYERDSAGGIAQVNIAGLTAYPEGVYRAR